MGAIYDCFSAVSFGVDMWTGLLRYEVCLEVLHLGSKRGGRPTGFFGRCMLLSGRGVRQGNSSLWW